MSGGARRLERISVCIFDDHQAISDEVAGRIAGLIRERAEEGRAAVLGLATGSTPVGIYRELARLHGEEGLDFSNVVTFNLDEYFPMEPGSPHSYHRFMHENLFDHVNVPSDQIHIPRGDLPREEMDEHAEAYEQAIRDAGGIDFQILGIGRSGHVGFNEPGSWEDSRTRLLYLDTITRGDAASDFFGEENVPPEAVTMGVATILEAREIALIATGEHKASIVRRAVEGPIHADVAATFLQEHPDATVYLDPAAAADLTRIRTPWLLGDVDWTADQELEAVIWLSQESGRPILHLRNEDYRERHLSGLVARYGSAEPLNGRAFNSLVAKIRGKSRLPRERRIVVFSPHPDDDVISMGGILRKLVENDNEITVAYQTSGNIAVFDHDVRRYLEFVRRAAGVLDVDDNGLHGWIDRIEACMAAKAPDDVDDVAVQNLKRVIREAEAIGGLEVVGLSSDDARFLNLPFYQTGKVKKDPIGPGDVAITLDFLHETKPDMVFAAGDLSDPHGTHRMCLEAVTTALEQYEDTAPDLWLYRGAWQEWPLAEASLLVPMSADELRRKKMAIFKHQSQKDVAPFPGPDPREFWQRVEDRNTGTAEALRKLGLPAYFAMEAYVVVRDGRRLRPSPFATADLGEM